MFWLVAAALIAATFGILTLALIALFAGMMGLALFAAAASALSLAFCIALSFGARAYVRRAEAQWPAQGRFISAGKARVHVREAGKAGAPRVLLIHGANANLRELWTPFADTLAEDFHVLAMDRPGLGYSSRPKRARTLKVQAELAAAVLRERGGEPAVIVGHSYGASVALRLAIEAPQLVRGLVLIAPACHKFPGKPIWWARLAATPLLGRLFCGLLIPNLGPLLARTNIGRNFYPGEAPKDYYDANGVGLAFRPSAFRASAEDVCRANAEFAAQTPRYPEIFAPTIIITAEKDRVLSPKRHARALAATLASAELVIAPDTGHMPHQLRPDLGIAAIRRVNAMASVSEPS
ncbi:MAG TPA: alpha/beta hydrolase [Terricaulis sp.]|nr:alpha/beta hydrolase [Terricaulis sp.]